MEEESTCCDVALAPGTEVRGAWSRCDVRAGRGNEGSGIIVRRDRTMIRRKKNKENQEGEIRYYVLCENEPLYNILHAQ